LLHVDGTLTRTEKLLSKTYATMSNLDAATKIWAGSAKEQTAAVQDLATDAHGTLSEVNGVAQSLHGSADALHTELDSLHKTTDQATTLAAALTTSAQTMNQTIASAQPLLVASTRAVDHFDSLVNSPDLSHALSHVQGMTSSGDAILADARKVADKETADWLRPVPWWRVPIQKGGALIDIGAAVARHTP
jgi:hypothetical protein